MARKVGQVHALAAALLLFSVRVGWGQAYSQNFDSGSATFTANDPYWITQNPDDDNFIVQNTNSLPGGIFNNFILADASGSGYFLFDGTNTYPTNGGVIPTGNDQFFISPTFTVTPNTNYQVAFALTNADTTGIAGIQPQLDGTLLGSPISAVGDFTTNGWQNFTFTWNSGANSTASLILHDFQTQAIGNDFGLDNVSVTALPEPASLGILALSGLLISRRRRAASSRSR